MRRKLRRTYWKQRRWSLMYVPPAAQIRSRREEPADRRDRDAIRAFAYDLGLTLREYCLLY